MDWKGIFNKAVSGVPNPKRLKELENLGKKMWEEWTIYSLQQYITHFSLSSAEIKELQAYCVECEKFYEESLKLRKYHFGYPANMLVRTPLYNIFSAYERSGFLSNNCGDTFEKGNYRMDSKDIEKDILRMFAQKFGIDGTPYWGYITSGGSESNSWGIDNGFRIYPNGILYYCESAHYSVKKHAENYRKICIPQVSPLDESINCDVLFEMISANPNPAILVLTWGTTKFGSCDDILQIIHILKSKGREFYIHVDAALYGGIPNNQIDAPIIKINDLEINSISVSLHKYIGVPFVKSVLLSTEKPDSEIIPYIGVADSTTSGSRDILPFSMRQQVFDVLNLTEKGEYVKNIVIFERLLQDNGISYIRSGKGNIFVIDKPSNAICHKYQLSTFDVDIDGKKIHKAHIIIFPYQSETIICELIQDICKERGIYNVARDVEKSY